MWVMKSELKLFIFNCHKLLPSSDSQMFYGHYVNAYHGKYCPTEVITYLTIAMYETFKDQLESTNRQSSFHCK